MEYTFKFINITGKQLDYLTGKLKKEMSNVKYNVDVLIKDEKYNVTFLDVDIARVANIGVVYGRLSAEFEIENEKLMYNPEDTRWKDAIKGKQVQKYGYAKGNFVDPYKVEHIVSRGGFVDTKSDELLDNGFTRTTVSIYWMNPD